MAIFQVIKAEYRVMCILLSDDYLKQRLRLAVSNYSPDYNQLANDMQ